MAQRRKNRRRGPAGGRGSCRFVCTAMAFLAAGAGAAAAGGVAALWPRPAAAARAPACPPQPAAPATVVAADGPLSLRLADGRTVRLAGLVVPADIAGAAEAAQAALGAASAGRWACILATGPADRWNRLPARVIWAEAAGPACLPPPQGGDGPAEALVAGGLAVLFTAAGEAPSGDVRSGDLPSGDLPAGDLPAGACAAAASALPSLAATEERARQAGRGLWAPEKGLVRRADDPHLARQAGRFAVVEGQVRSVGMAGKTFFLNFGSRWIIDFTVRIAESDRAGLAARGLDPETLAGRTVRVRGWLEERDGPQISLAAPAALAPAEDPPGTGGR